MKIKREIGEKGQVVVPRDIRRHLGLEVGVSVTFEVEGNQIIIRKEKDAIEIVKDFFDTPRLKGKVSVSDLKAGYEEQYG
jgi:AbrB family looped-hinge helix DNA binding protein